MTTDKNGADTQTLQPYSDSKLAPVGSLRATVRPHIAAAIDNIAQATSRAPDLADEVVGLVRALRLYWECRTDRMKGE
jgi:hypothetical protein